MKALSVQQPWAQLIAQGDKTIEVRSWVAKYRGPLLIVSSRAQIVTAKLEAGGEQVLPVGIAITIVDLVEVRPLRPDDVESACISQHRQGMWAWVLKDPRPAKPLAVMGRLKIFDVPGKISEWIA